MSKGSYRGGSTLVGWGANAYVAPSLAGRKYRLRAQIHALTARTPQTRAELEAQDAAAREKQRLRPPKGVRLTNPASAAEIAKDKADAAKKPKARRRTASMATVVVEKKKLGPRLKR